VIPDIFGLAIRRFDVQSGAERPGARCAQHNRMHRLVEFNCAPGLDHLFAHRAVEGVELIRPIQRDGGDVVGGVDVEQDGFKTVGAHLHCQSGARFSTKAFGPSAASSCAGRARGMSRP